MCEAMQLLEAVFKTITAAISQHPANRLFFEEQIGKLLQLTHIFVGYLKYEFLILLKLYFYD